MKYKAAPIGEVIKVVFTKIEKDKTTSEDTMNRVWKGLVGEAAFKHSRPNALRKGVLTVYVDTPAWLHDLTIKKRGILKGLKTELGKDRISEIHFKVGEWNA